MLLLSFEPPSLKLREMSSVSLKVKCKRGGKSFACAQRQIEGWIQRNHILCLRQFVQLCLCSSVEMIQCLLKQADTYFLSYSRSAVLRGNESDGEAKPFCCCFIHILCAPPCCQLWYLPAVSQKPSLLPSVILVSASPFAEIPIVLLKKCMIYILNNRQFI